MKNFIRQNIVLFITICTILFIALLMSYFIIEVNVKRTEANVLLNELKDKIEQLNAYKPYPSEKNIRLIRDDINTIKLKIFQLESVFGNIYAKPLSFFIQQFKEQEIQSLKNQLEALERESTPANKKRIEEVKQNIAILKSENNKDFEIYFLKKWKTYIENKKKAKEQISLKELLCGFVDTQQYDIKTFQNAKNTFLAEMQKQTLEPLNTDIVNDYILNALGIPLFFSRVKSKTMAVTVQDEINKILAANNVEMNGKQIIFFSEITTVPTEEQAPYIVNYSRFLEDFYKRLARAKIENIESYNKINGIKGTEDNNFLVFRYQINVVASQEALRNFLNSLQESYKDNRVYVIKSLALLAVNDSANNLPTYIPPKTTAQLQQVKILLGTSDMIKASITVDYIIFKNKILD